MNKLQCSNETKILSRVEMKNGRAAELEDKGEEHFPRYHLTLSAHNQDYRTPTKRGMWLTDEDLEAIKMLLESGRTDG